jgi:ethanolamine ammonia-lyase large subunit
MENLEEWIAYRGKMARCEQRAKGKTPKVAAAYLKKMRQKEMVLSSRKKRAFEERQRQKRRSRLLHRRRLAAQYYANMHITGRIRKLVTRLTHSRVDQ